MKRAFDFFVSLGAILFFLPLLAVLALIIRVTSPGPVVFRQVRIGRGEQPFTIYKFRSMVANADKVGPYFTSSDDPRITRIGRVLRKTSLDELPQLFNVLFGTMSLVGPRPDTPAQKENYQPQDWATRCSVRPGITGLAQARLRSSATEEQRLALDLEYIRTQNLALDVAILWETVMLVVRRRGAN